MRDLTIKLRFNFQHNCWEVYTYIIKGKPLQWKYKWFRISVEVARYYATHIRVPVSIEDTVS